MATKEIVIGSATANVAKSLNEDARSFTIPQGFQVQAVDAAIAAQIPGIIQPQPLSSQAPLAFLQPTGGLRTDAPPLEPPAQPELPCLADKAPELGSLGIALEKFVGKFKGRGLNMIFRPRNTKSAVDGDAADLKDNLLEFDLTEEKLQFLGSSVLKDVPNRGFGQQEHVNLRGTPYIQFIDNVLNPNTVQPDSKLRTSIHFEPGLFMRTPPLTNPPVGATISRMASIPHGTTINAQGWDPTEEKPTVPDIPIRKNPTIPFLIDHPEVLFSNFLNLVYEKKDNLRIPTKFPGESAITRDIFFEPNHLLKINNDKKDIVSHIEFKVSTKPTKELQGGGTDNIAFLAEPEEDRTDGQPGTKTFDPTSLTTPRQDSRANANASSMETTFWISTVRHKVEIPPWTPGVPDPIVEIPNNDPSIQHPKAFKLILNRPVTKPTQFDIFSTQIQYSQLVLLDFGSLSWPHISVATLVPDDDDPTDLLVVNVDLPSTED